MRDETLTKYMGNLTEISARLISGEEVQAIAISKGCEQLPVTQVLIKKLQDIQTVNPTIFDVYLMIPDPDPRFLRFITNADRIRTPVGCGERYDTKADPKMLEGFLKTTVDLAVHEDKWGSWISAYSPVKTGSGKVVAILGMDIAQKTIVHIQRTFLWRFIAAMTGCLIVALVLGFFSSLWLTRPVRHVVKGMEMVANGNLDHKLERFSQTEFDRIAVIFNKMTESLRRMMIELETTVRENERVKREFEIATEIQKAIFPEHPPEVEGLEIEAKSVPAKEVGGDYFDFLPVASKGKMGFIIADAAGKGLPGTLYMTRSRSVFKVVSSEEEQAGETLSRSNAYIASDTSSRKGMFITVLYLLYDKEKKQMTYSNAGHYFPLWYQNAQKDFTNLKTGGVPVGISSEQQYPEEMIQLSSDDLLVLYTDGVIEARAENGEMFGVDRLKQLIRQNSSLNAHDLFKKIETALAEFTVHAPPFDDMTLIVIRVK